ncbi:MAG: hypothetical protein AB1578_17550 [Thermodesulfobacteriota bacterium]
MGIVHATFSLANPRRPDLRPVEVTALVGTAQEERFHATAQRRDEELTEPGSPNLAQPI